MVLMGRKTAIRSEREATASTSTSRLDDVNLATQTTSPGQGESVAEGTTSVAGDAEAVIMEDDMDSDLLGAELEGMFEEVQREPVSYMELLLGDWDGFDMASAVLNDLTVELAPPVVVHNATQEVRPVQDFSVSSLADEFQGEFLALAQPRRYP